MATKLSKEENVMSTTTTMPAADPWTREHYWGAIDALATDRVRKSGVPITKEQAVADVLATPAGARLYERYVAAAPQAPSQPVANTATLPSSPAWSRIEDLADAMVQKSTTGLTKVQAVADVLKTAEGARLYEAYLTASPVAS